MLDAGSPHVLAMQYRWQGNSLIAVHNFSNEQQTVTIKSNKALEDLYSHRLFSPAGEKLTVPLQGYGFVWLRSKE
jgi:maltose alpha-D-glucosyltransferase/alpha-amylase